MPSDGRRDLPDVSLSAALHDGYAIFQLDQYPSANYFSTVGGTSASSPSFAGLMALVVQKTGQRQGNANTRFYQLGSAQYGSGGSAVFHDITSANNSVPGVTGYPCTTGYDLATGLGSVDANALASNWSPTPDLTIANTHTGNFTQGQTGATYSLIVTNAGNGPTSGTAAITDNLPTTLTATSLSGTGWSCNIATLTCTRSDPLAPNRSYPALTVTVNVASNASSTAINTATVSGGGEINTANNTATDPTTIVQVADMTIIMSHTGSFWQGETGAQYSITVANAGAGPSSGTVTVTQTLPTGLTATAIGGTGWTCVIGTLTCSRSDVLFPGSNYPAIILTIDVTGNAASSVINTATVSGGGEINTGNNAVNDQTSITVPPVRIDAAPYESILAAYAAVSSGKTIKIQEGEFAEALLFTRGILVALEGGFDGTFDSVSGITVISQPVTITSGSVTVNNIVIK